MATPHRSRHSRNRSTLHPPPFARPYSAVELRIECALLPRSAVCEPCRRGAGLLSSLALVSGKSQRYSRAAKELWKFCNTLEAETAAAMIQDQPPRDWWERAAPR